MIETRGKIRSPTLTQADKKVLKTCPVCGRKFLGWFSEKYDSEECRIEGRRVKDRNRQRKGRKVLERRDGLLSQELGELNIGETSYPMYKHEVVPTMFANFNYYHAKDGRKHVRSYYDLLREIAKLNGGGDMWRVLATMAPKEE